MKMLIKGFLLAGLLVVSFPEQAQAQSVWERAQEAVERERAQRESDRNADQERERAQRNQDRSAEQEREASRTDRREADRQQAPRRAEQRGRDQRGRDQHADPRRNERVQDRNPHQRRGGQAGGPAFCRSGEGHPVFGIEWCHQKGFATPTWQRGTLGDVIIGRDTRRSGTVAGGILDRVLGRDASRRAMELGQRAGFSGDLVGTWLDASTLELTVGGQPVARLVDETNDGRVDYALIARY